MTMAIDPVAAVRRPRSRPLPLVSWLRARTPPRAIELARSRLAQFVALGALIFAVAPSSKSSRRIDVSGDRLRALVAAEVARAGAPQGSAGKAREVEERMLEDEILYREGLRLGLDRSDGIVRERVVQKVLFLAEEIDGASRPAKEADLRAFFERNRERWAIPERFHLTQVFSHRREALAPPVAAGDPLPGGEAGPAPRELDGTRDQVSATFGASFADALAALPERSWSGPVQSAFGWHLVRVDGHTPARPARFEEVRPRVVEADSIFRRQEAVARFVEKAFLRYEVAIDGQPVGELHPTRRIAFRSVSSGED